MERALSICAKKRRVLWLPHAIRGVYYTSDYEEERREKRKEAVYRILSTLKKSRHLLERKRGKEEWKDLFIFLPST